MLRVDRFTNRGWLIAIEVDACIECAMWLPIEERYVHGRHIIERLFGRFKRPVCARCAYKSR
jgi:hypothetical protein